MILNENLFLECLTLKNFATFKDQTIHFDDNLNAIVGETGSGKSLILDALQLVLGHRADKKLVRKGADFTHIEAVFRCQDVSIKTFLDEQGYPFDESEIIIKRIIYGNGKSKSYINYQSCNLSILNNFAKRFIDLVGQFENQKLLSGTYQLVLLDNFAGNSKLKENYILSFQKLSTLRLKLEELKKSNQDVAQKLDYLRFQNNELNDLNASIADENDLLNKKDMISNHEKFAQLSQEVQLLVNGSDESDGLLNQVRRLIKVLSGQQQIIDLDHIDKLEDVYNFINELDHLIQNNANIEFHDEDIQFVIERLDQYQRLKRKYNTDTEGLIKIHNELREQIEELENYEITLGNLDQEILSAKEFAFNDAQELHESRLNASRILSERLTKEVNKLRMNGATVNIQVDEELSLSVNGISRVTFLAETNPGEGFYKVKEIASGGELSRILLALRQVVSGQDSISIFLFDEIDTGIGGETALCIGKALQQVSKNSQVIAITHLPQIASYAQKLILVDKKFDESKQRTFSTIQEISGTGIKKEIKKMTPVAQD